MFVCLHADLISAGVSVTEEEGCFAQGDVDIARKWFVHTLLSETGINTNDPVNRQLRTA